jgi:hypothetical protein
LRNVVKKIDHFFGAVPHPKDAPGDFQKGVCPLLFGGFEGGGVPLIAKKILEL